MSRRNPIGLSENVKLLSIKRAGVRRVSDDINTVPGIGEKMSIAVGRCMKPVYATKKKNAASSQGVCPKHLTPDKVDGKVDLQRRLPGQAYGDAKD